MDHSLNILSDSHNDVAALPHPEAGAGGCLLVSLPQLLVPALPWPLTTRWRLVLIPNASPSFQQSFAWAHLFGQSPEHETTPLAIEPGNKGSVVLFWYSWLEVWELPSKTLEKCGAVLQRFRTCTNGRSPPAENAYYWKEGNRGWKL